MARIDISPSLSNIEVLESLRAKMKDLDLLGVGIETHLSKHQAALQRLCKLDRLEVHLSSQQAALLRLCRLDQLLTLVETI